MAPRKQNKATTATIPTKTGTPSRTPSRSPIKKRTTITATQKQALIDNLQLEITERARKLRAQYALHAQGLRARLEMRINRIPHSLRNVNIGELINKYMEDASPQKKPAAPATGLTRSKAIIRREKAPAVTRSSPGRMAGRKRLSNEMSSDDKENADAENNLDLPKKRAKATATIISANPGTAAGRSPSRKTNASQVLSPKSHNSRTLPSSPVKASSPPKSMLARPVSPTKPSAALPARQRTTKAAPQATKTTSKAAMAAAAPPIRGKRSAATLEKKPSRLSSNSRTSESSTGTTIVKTKPAKSQVRKGIMNTVAKAMGATTSTARKATATKKETATSASGGRVLRSRK